MRAPLRKRRSGRSARAAGGHDRKRSTKPAARAAGSVIDLGRTVTGVAVKQGAPAPDISTPENFKQALLAARGVSYSDPAAGGSSGNYFAGLLEKLGIAEEIGKKAVLGKRGYEVAQAVVDGRAELGTTFISELLTVPGVTIIGPLPGELYFANTYTAAIPAKSAQPARRKLCCACSPIRPAAPAGPRPAWSRPSRTCAA